MRYQLTAPILLILTISACNFSSRSSVKSDASSDPATALEEVLSKYSSEKLAYNSFNQQFLEKTGYSLSFKDFNEKNDFVEEFLKVSGLEKISGYSSQIALKKTSQELLTAPRLFVYGNFYSTGVYQRSLYDFGLSEQENLRLVNGIARLRMIERKMAKDAENLLNQKLDVYFVIGFDPEKTYDETLKQLEAVSKKFTTMIPELQKMSLSTIKNFIISPTVMIPFVQGERDTIFTDFKGTIESELDNIKKREDLYHQQAILLKELEQCLKIKMGSYPFSIQEQERQFIKNSFCGSASLKKLQSIGYSIHLTLDRNSNVMNDKQGITGIGADTVRLTVSATVTSEQLDQLFEPYILRLMKNKELVAKIAKDFPVLKDTKVAFLIAHNPCSIEQMEKNYLTLVNVLKKINFKAPVSALSLYCQKEGEEPYRNISVEDERVYLSL